MTRFLPRRGLRSSVTLGFAAGALALSVALALGTYFTARHFLLDQRERTATRQAYTDAALVRDGLLTSGTEVSEVLGSISPPAGAVIYVRLQGEWYSTALDGAGPERTDQVQPIVEAGSVGLGWTDDTTPHSLVVGIPLPAVGAEYYEVTVADELDRTLSTMGVVLAVCAALTTIAGGLLGHAASRRLLTPLAEVASAAVRVSAGDLSTRLQTTSDPDLAALVGSFNHMVDALHERIEQDARFAADVSHELRTPVTTLTTSLSLLQHTPDLAPRPAQAVQLMTEELERFRVALEDLLTLGRLDAGAHETTPTATGIHELVRNALVTAGQPADLVPDQDVDPMVQVDRRQVLRAFTNLFRNAELHGNGLTDVAIRRQGDLVEILVGDRGPGVPAAERERIFERFARAGGQKSGTGSGLGLSIVARTIRNHGGDVWCAERPGGGAVFGVRLPLDTDGPR